MNGSFPPSSRAASAGEKSARPIEAERRRNLIPGVGYWRTRPRSALRDLVEVVGVLAAVTVAGWFVPISYHAFGHIYLLVVIALSLRVGRWASLLAAVLSGAAWNFAFMAPRLSFSMDDFEEDLLLLGTYFAAALIGGQLAARIREQERQERHREQRAAALYHLTRALAAARTLDEAVEAALRQAEELFEARTALQLRDGGGGWSAHPGGTLPLSEAQRAQADEVRRTGQPAGGGAAGARWDCLHVPLVRGGTVVGVFSLALGGDGGELTPAQRDLIDGFAAQIALAIEREQLRAASEREKLQAESHRLRRTLLDSVSHELKTPLAVLRTAVENLGTGDAGKRAALVGEMRLATQRLDRLVGNLLNQTRLEAGALRPQPDWCDLRDVIAAARRAVGDALAVHRLKIELPADLPLWFADAALLEQALANLLLNAALHTPPGTAVSVTAGRDVAAGRVWVAVNDDGPGVPTAMRAGIFEKFSRGPQARAGGVGLGLSIVRGFLQAQGGDAVLTESATGGACFTLSLPFAAPETVPGDET